MTNGASLLTGLVPGNLKVRSARILLDALEVDVDVGFHEFEIGAPQRLLVSIEIWLEDARVPADDDPLNAWNYDVLRSDIRRIASERRYNLQESFAHRLFDVIAAKRGVRALRIRTSKPDIYADAAGVGAEIASFEGLWPLS